MPIENSQDDSSLSLDEMLDQIFDEDTEVIDESQAPEPEVELDDLIDEPVEDQTDLPNESEYTEASNPGNVSGEEIQNQADEFLGNLDDESIGVLLSDSEGSSPEELVAKQKRRQMLWALFGVACILAIVLPATFVFLKARSIANNTSDKPATIVPVNKNNGNIKSVETTSSETTKTATTVTEDMSSSSDSSSYKEIDLEEWNYYVHGCNIFAPARGPRVKDAAGQINAIYKATAYDALDILVNKANGVQITIPVFTDSGESANTDGTSTSGDTVKVTTSSSSNTSSSTTTKTRMYLDAIGSSSSHKIAVWIVGRTSYQTAIGDQIGSTGWKVTNITSTTATIKNGSKTYTLRVGGSAVQ